MKINSLRLKMYLTAVIGFVCFSVLNTARAASTPHLIPGIENYACYYDTGRLEDLAAFDMVIISAQAYTAEEIAQLQTNGTVVIGYVSVGEYVGELLEGDGTGPISDAEGLTDGGYASYYLDDVDHDGVPDQNGIWGGYFVNAGDVAWQDYVITNLAAYVIDTKGCDGVFLDTVGIVDYNSPYAWTTNGMIDLISELRTSYSNEYIVQNRGFSVFAGSEPYVNALMFESFTSTYDFNTDSYVYMYSGGGFWTTNEGNAINAIRDYPAATSVNVLALDYTESTNATIYQACVDRAESFGFIPSVSDISLCSIYAFDMLVIDGKFHDWSDDDLIGTDSAEDVATGDQVDFVSLWAKNENGTLYICYSTAENIDFSVAWRYAIYLDTDDNASTGYIGSDSSYGVGADYMIEGSTLYQYTGNGTSWSWSWVGSMPHAYADDQLEMAISETTLNVSGDYTIQIMLEGRNTTTTDYANDNKTGSEYVSSRIVIDGSFSDWLEDDMIGTDSSGDVSSGDEVDFITAWAHHDKGDLFLSYQTAENIDFTGAWRYAVYLDTDNNASTGFIGSDSSYGVGAEYMIEGSTLFQYTGNGTSWSWDWISSLPSAYMNDKIEIAISESDLSLSGDYTIEIMLEGRNTTTTDFATDNKTGLQYPPAP